MSYLCTFTMYLLGCSHPCSLHIFWPLEDIFLYLLSTWFGHVACFRIPSSDVFAWHGVDPCLVFAWETARVPPPHKTQHGLLFCPFFSLMLFVHSPTISSFSKTRSPWTVCTFCVIPEQGKCVKTLVARGLEEHFSSCVLSCQFLVLAGNRFWFTYLCT